MDFDKFKRAYSPSTSFSDTSKDCDLEIFASSPGATEFFSLFNGISVANGVYRVHKVAEIKAWSRRVTSRLFRKYTSRVECFGYDWKGRHFAIETNRKNTVGIPLVTMFDPETAKAFESPLTFSEFHNEELVDCANDALDVQTFQQWRTANQNRDLTQLECVACKIPLFLGGKDTLSNLETTDLEVYWELMGQLLDKTKDLSAGTKIIGVSKPDNNSND